jgi:rhodanese-related sulfurtransferase
MSKKFLFAGAVLIAPLHSLADQVGFQIDGGADAWEAAGYPMDYGK